MIRPYKIILVLSVSVGYNAFVYPQPAIPLQFQGEWNVELDDCGTGNNASRLRIYSDLIRFYESTGRVKQVSIINDNVVTIAATYTGEGSTWERQRTFQLLNEGSSLKDISNPSFSMVRHRCQNNQGNEKAATYNPFNTALRAGTPASPSPH